MYRLTPTATITGTDTPALYVPGRLIGIVLGSAVYSTVTLRVDFGFGLAPLYSPNLSSVTTGGNFTLLAPVSMPVGSVNASINFSVAQTGTTYAFMYEDSPYYPR